METHRLASGQAPVGSLPAEVSAASWIAPFRSREMAAVYATACRVAPGNAKVLVTGESGSGKEIVARLVHSASTRVNRQMVAVNCAAFTESLLESELFGHVKGSFTGAFRDHAGKLEQAHGGTIFLDEIGDMSRRMQAMLLRFLESGELQPVGADHPVRRVDVRVIAATNRDLGALVRAGEFREDLFYRINVINLRVPPLRERREDILPLIEFFAARTGREVTFTPGALAAFERYSWPGNVRELLNLIEQAVWMKAGPGAIDAADLPPHLLRPAEAKARPVADRRRTASDVLLDGLVEGRYGFWEDVHRMFLDRDVTRRDLRGLIERGLMRVGGSYRSLLGLFRLRQADYKRFMNFLAAHDCKVEFEPFRRQVPEPDPAGRAHTAKARGAGRKRDAPPSEPPVPRGPARASAADRSVPRGGERVRSGSRFVTGPTRSGTPPAVLGEGDAAAHEPVSPGATAPGRRVLRFAAPSSDSRLVG